ncbi:unnamed protein product [Coccothraustes coccothraustes]
MGRDGVGRPRAAVGALAGGGRRAPSTAGKGPAHRAARPRRRRRCRAAIPKPFPEGIKQLRRPPPLPFWGYSRETTNRVFLPNSAMLCHATCDRCKEHPGNMPQLRRLWGTSGSRQRGARSHLPYCFLQAERVQLVTSPESSRASPEADVCSSNRCQRTSLFLESG